MRLKLDPQLLGVWSSLALSVLVASSCGAPEGGPACESDCPGSGFCAAEGGSCGPGQPCCAGSCLDGFCVAADAGAGSCKATAASCQASAECCSGSCEGGTCAPQAGVADGGAQHADPTGDAGTQQGPADAGQPDAGRADAGVAIPDGGTGTGTGPTDAGSTLVPDAGTGTGTPDAGTPLPPDAGTAAPSCANISGDRATQVCLRWKCDRADLDEGTWTGQVSGCAAGDNVVNRRNALKQLNLQRFLAQLPEVTDDATRNQKAQQCALLMQANGRISHTPSSSWTCYSAGGAEAAGNSNIATAPGVESVDLYMVDRGNPTTLGHRRWILSPELGPVGLGSTGAYSCMWVIGGTGTATRPFVAWPPPGPFPLQAFNPVRFYPDSLNTTGWSIQSQTINLSSASVSVTEDGVSRPVTVTVLAQWYGSTYALRFVPVGWTPQAGRSYEVSVSGTSTPIRYTVDVVDCQ